MNISCDIIYPSSWKPCAWPHKAAISSLSTETWSHGLWSKNSHKVVKRGEGLSYKLLLRFSVKTEPEVALEIVWWLFYRLHNNVKPKEPALWGCVETAAHPLKNTLYAAASPSGDVLDLQFCFENLQHSETLISFFCSEKAIGECDLFFCCMHVVWGLYTPFRGEY